MQNRRDYGRVKTRRLRLELVSRWKGEWW